MRRIISIGVSHETFESIFLIDTARDMPYHDVPDCPLVQDPGYSRGGRGKCDCRNELRLLAIEEVGHPCGDAGRCPVRTYLARH